MKDIQESVKKISEKEGYTMVFLICLVSIIVSVFKKPRLINFAVSFIGLFLFFISVEVFVVTIEWSRLAPVRFFPSNLRQIGFALEKCAKKNKGNLPSAANWYDSLLKCDPIKYAFRNDGQKHDDGLSEFAFNANISGLKLVELPKNTVLIFETLLAKNPAGGPELMSTNNHPIKGCFVLFTDMHIAFVRAEDFNNLRWKP